MGTFNLTDESPKALTEARRATGRAEADFFVMAVGETRKLPRRTQH